MSPEGQGMDKKSLRKVLGGTANWDAIVVDCVAFAKASGGLLLIGIENDAGMNSNPSGKHVARKKYEGYSWNIFHYYLIVYGQ